MASTANARATHRPSGAGRRCDSSSMSADLRWLLPQTSYAASQGRLRAPLQLPCWELCFPNVLSRVSSHCNCLNDSRKHKCTKQSKHKIRICAHGHNVAGGEVMIG